MKNFIYLISCVCLLSCEKNIFDFSHFYNDLEVEYESFNVTDSLFVINGLPYQIMFFPGTREDVMTENLDRGEVALTYLNVMKVNSLYFLLYSCANRAYLFEENLSDIEIRSKFSSDGLFLYDDNSCKIIAGNDSYTGINSGMEQCLFYDKTNDIYKIIYNQQDNGRIAMFMVESKDCVNWKNRKLIIEQFYDSQFSAIEKDGKYFVYHRLWVNGIRAIGLTVLSADGKILNPARVLYISGDTYFNHTYNSAVSNVDSVYDLCFPTKYNAVTNEISVNLGYIKDSENIVISDHNLIKMLSRKSEAKWMVICPGLVPTDVLNEYWLYYHLSFKEHGSRELKASKYCRIKLRLEKLK